MLTPCGTSSVSRTNTEDGESHRSATSGAGSDGVRPDQEAAGGRVDSHARGAQPAVLIRVGSRGSRLALTQAELAASHLRDDGLEIALVPITTAGDRDRTKPFGEIGARGVFVKELEEALLD